MHWKKLLESISESVNDHLRLRHDYLVAENRILRKQINGRVQLTDSKRKALTFAREGAKLIIADMNEDGGQQTVHMITEQGGDAMFVQTDVTQATFHSLGEDRK